MRKNEKQLITRNDVIIPKKVYNTKGAKKSLIKRIFLFVPLIIIVLLTMCSCSKSYEENYIVFETNTDEYSDGFEAARDYYYLRADIVTLYKADAITYKQLSNYIENQLELHNLSVINCIYPTAIKSYNSSIKDIDLIDYEKYELKTTKSFIQGFKEFIQLNAYNQIITYYYDLDQISDIEYAAFQIVYDNNDTPKIINYARDIIEECIGNPNEVIVSTEWRKYVSIEDYLKNF